MVISKKILYVLLALAIAIIGTGIVNFILQLLISIVDPFNRRISASSLYIIVLWIVTGVFCSIFTFSFAESFLGKSDSNYRFVGDILFGIAIGIILFSVFLLYDGNAGRSALEFSLLFNNAVVPLCFFIGIGGMALIMRNLYK